MRFYFHWKTININNNYLILNIMKQKILWCLGFVVAAAISCWATSSSFLLMMPSLFSSNVVVRTIMVWLMVLLIYVLASFAMKWVIDSLNNDGYMSHLLPLHLETSLNELVNGC